MRFRRPAAILVAVLLAAAGAPAAVADDASPKRPTVVVATNGFGVQSVAFADGFENPVVPANGFVTFVAGQPMGVWTVTRGDVHLIGQNFWQAAEGVQSLDLDGAVNGGVAVAFHTIPLFAYRVSYALAGNPDSGPTVKTGKVRVNGATAQEFTFDITGKSRANMGYVKKSFAVLATSGSMTLEFISTTTPGGWGPVIDDVVVEKCLLILCL